MYLYRHDLKLAEWYNNLIKIIRNLVFYNILHWLLSKTVNVRGYTALVCCLRKRASAQKRQKKTSLLYTPVIVLSFNGKILLKSQQKTLPQIPM